MVAGRAYATGAFIAPLQGCNIGEIMIRVTWFSRSRQRLGIIRRPIAG